MDSAKPRSPTPNEHAAHPAKVGAIFKTFFTAGAISFGGGVVAYLREYVVHRQKWLDDESFLDALELSETLPGLNSVNMSVIIGDRLRGVSGAAAAVAGLLLPGMVVMMTLGVLWSEQRHNPYLRAVLIGVAASAVGLLTTVTLQLGHRQFTRLADLLFIAATFVAVSLLKISLVIVLLTLGPLAIWYYWPTAHVSETAHLFRHLRERLHSHRAIWRH
jgi:chromate transporter